MTYHVPNPVFQTKVTSISSESLLFCALKGQHINISGSCTESPPIRRFRSSNSVVQSILANWLSFGSVCLYHQRLTQKSLVFQPPHWIHGLTDLNTFESRDEPPHVQQNFLNIILCLSILTGVYYLKTIIQSSFSEQKFYFKP